MAKNTAFNSLRETILANNKIWGKNVSEGAQICIAARATPAPITSPITKPMTKFFIFIELNTNSISICPCARATG